MLPQGYDIRSAVAGDVVFLPEIERIAGLLFESYAGQLGLTDQTFAHVKAVEFFGKAQQAGHLWVAVAPAGDIIGFALVVDVCGYAHLDELDVLPSHGRQGIGSALVATVCSWAKDAGYPAVTLRTFRDVPWNGPFYQRQGFRVVDSSALSSEHVGFEASERQHGLRTDLRVTMAYITRSHEALADSRFE